MSSEENQLTEEEIVEYYQQLDPKSIGLNIDDLKAVYNDGIQQYLFVELLGKGTYSFVYKAIVAEERNALFPEEFAIKVLKNKKYWSAIKREMDVVDRIIESPHHNIIEFKEKFSCGKTGVTYLVLELAPIGDLFEVLQRINFLGQKIWRPLRPEYCRHLIRGIAEGVRHLFSIGISHGDIKLENILMNFSESTPNTPQDFSVNRLMRMTPKLTDFNNSKMGKPGDRPRCSPATASPESIIVETYYDMKRADVYSVGACLLAMLLACYPFIPPNGIPEEDLPLRCVLLKKDRKLLKHLIGSFDVRLRKLLLKVLEPNPNKRITIDNFLSHEWIQYIDQD